MDKISVFAVATLILGVYIRTLSPSIAGGDSGELVAEGCILGTAHPPGYPLFTAAVYVLKNGFDFGSVAYRINLLSATFTTLAAFFIGCTVQISSGSGSTWPTFGGTIFGMGMFSFSPLIWQYAVTAEVFPLNTMFSALLVYLVLKFSKTRETYIAVLGAFICGLALCNQHTIILYEAPLILWMVFLLRRRLFGGDVKLLLLISIAFLVGLVPYVCMVIWASRNQQPGSWGHVITLEGFLNHFLRKDYGTFQLFSGESGKNAEGFYKRSSAYIHDLVYNQGMFVAPMFSLLGILSWHRLTSERIVDKSPKNQMLPAIEINVDASSENNELSSTATAATPNQSKKQIIDNKSPRNSKKKSQQQQLNHQPKESSSTIQQNISLSGPNNVSITTCNHVDSDIQVSFSESSFAPLAILLTQFIYFLVFHNLANLPLGDKLLFGVHQRFWMQPNVLVFVWAGIGFNTLFKTLEAVISGEFTLTSLVKIPLLAPRGEKKQQRNKAAIKSKIANSNDVDKVVSAKGDVNIKKSGVISTMLHTISIIAATACVCMQLQKHYYMSDQSTSLHFSNYAKALLDPLPKNAILLVNYDMQWTSIRYIQKCEGYRSDVTAINLSMMTYRWFEHKRALYPHLTFPGKFHCAANSALLLQGGFTLHSFLTSNSKKHKIFLSGKLSYPDPEIDKNFDNMPVGLVSQLQPTSKAPNGVKYMHMNKKNWQKVIKVLPELPNEIKYPEETWEWTIGRDFKDRIADTAAYALQSAINVAATDALPLIEAVYWLESTIIIEQGKPTTSVLKNAGLAHVHLIQNKLLSDVNFPFPQDIFQTAAVMHWPTHDWKDWASNRFVALWGEFLDRKDAKVDPQYDTIKNMYTVAVNAAKGGK